MGNNLFEGPFKALDRPYKMFITLTVFFKKYVLIKAQLPQSLLLIGTCKHFLESFIELSWTLIRCLLAWIRLNKG